jgi:transglutaminase-like putative cysteine protease
LQKYLEESEIIDFNHPEIQKLAKELSKDRSYDYEIAESCFLYVRDNIRHSGDHKDRFTTCRASDVLKHKTGWCYAKSHLLASLLRANGIPVGFSYQRLSCSEYKKDVYCLHGLNYIYLKDYGWYRVDARGNREDIDAQFSPPVEQLAFKIKNHEYDLSENYSEPLVEVINALREFKTYDDIVNNFPDIVAEQ